MNFRHTVARVRRLGENGLISQKAMIYTNQFCLVGRSATGRAYVVCRTQASLMNSGSIKREPGFESCVGLSNHGLGQVRSLYLRECWRYFRDA